MSLSRSRDAARRPVSGTLAQVGELELLRRLRRWFGGQKHASQLALGIGDDAAWLRLGTSRDPSVVVTTDSLVEGVHFERGWTTPRDLGHKALAVNLSDLAAMGARPLAAFLALSLPPATPLADVRDFFFGLRAEGRRWSCPLAGGDLTRAPCWMICVTVLGRPIVPGRVARRDAGKPGQPLYVTGWPGEAAAGLAALRDGRPSPRQTRRFRRPVPRLAEAAALMRNCPDLAMMDVSDGLWRDAGNLATAGGVGVDLEPAARLAPPALRKLGKALRVDPAEWVLYGGEDYELLFATHKPLGTMKLAFQRAGLRTAIRRIGRLTSGDGVRLVDETGRPIASGDRSFEHFR